MIKRVNCLSYLSKPSKRWGGVLRHSSATIFQSYYLILFSCFLSNGIYAYEFITTSGVEKLATNKSRIININKGSSQPIAMHKPCSDAGKYQTIINRVSALYGVDTGLVKAVISAESCFKYRAVSKKGAEGLMQLMPFTAKRFGVTNSFDPMQNITGGVKYLKFLLNRFKGDIKLTAAAYNAGEGAVDHYGGVPPYKETRNYVSKVLKAYGKKSLPQRAQFKIKKATKENISKNNCLASSQIRSYTYPLFEGKFTRRYYLIKKGDSFLSISRDTGVKVARLKRLNVFSTDPFASLGTKSVLVWECQFTSK